MSLLTLIIHDRQESLPDILKLDHSHDESGEGDSSNRALRFILKGHLLDCYEMIYWPFVVDVIRGNIRSNQESRDIARKGLRICVQRINDNENGFFYRHHGTWLMIRSCTRSAMILIGAYLSGQTSLLEPDWVLSVTMVIRMLEYWEKDSQDIVHYIRVLTKLMDEVSVELPVF